MSNWAIVALLLLWAGLSRQNQAIATTVIPPDEELMGALFGG
jgi:hypothetical protein